MKLLVVVITLYRLPDYIVTVVSNNFNIDSWILALSIKRNKQ